MRKNECRNERWITRGLFPKMLFARYARKGHYYNRKSKCLLETRSDLSVSINMNLLELYLKNTYFGMAMDSSQKFSGVM